MKVSQLTLLSAVGLLGQTTFAHPGEDHHAEALERRSWLSQVERRDVSHCADSLKKRGLVGKAQARRQALVEKLRKKRGLSSKGEFDHTALCFTPR